MFKIVKAEQLSANVYMKVVQAPRVAKACEPGQFIIVRLDETAERIPLTICDYDREAGTVTIVFQPIGVSTSKMVDLKEGDYLIMDYSVQEGDTFEASILSDEEGIDGISAEM